LSRRIEAALRHETPAPLPGGFHSTLQRRLRVAAMLERERQIFLHRLLHVAVPGVLGIAVAAGVILHGDVSQTFLYEFPGFLGHVDYLTALASRMWWLSDNPALLVSFGAIGMTLLIAGAFAGIFRSPAGSRQPAQGPIP
jgi:hypothetical protein